MEDFGDIIFYILLAIFGIVGAIANKKKRNATGRLPQSGMPDMNDDSFSYDREEESRVRETPVRGATTQYEMIDNSSMETEASWYKDTMIQSSEDQALKMKAEYEGRYSEPLADDFASEGIAATDQVITAKEMEKGQAVISERENSWARELLDDFDLPAAIIYSEVLKRKDFV